MKGNCSFCGTGINPGRGIIYVKTDGTVYNFCSHKCEVNQIRMGRVPKKIRWTAAFARTKRKE